MFVFKQIISLPDAKNEAGLSFRHLLLEASFVIRRESLRGSIKTLIINKLKGTKNFGNYYIKFNL